MGSSPYAARPWLKHYDYWVRPHLSYPGRPLGDILSLTAIERPDRPATQFLGAQLTFLDLKRRSDALAVSLSKMGIVKGDRVGIMLPNCPQYIIAAFAVLRLGAVIVNINPSYTARELLTVATDSGVRIVITLDVLAPLVQGVRDQTAIEHVIVTSLAEYSAEAAQPPRIRGTLAFTDLVTSEATARLPEGRLPEVRLQHDFETIRPDDLAVLQYTGGTTGTPKGAMLTHANIWANVVQTESWTNPAYVIGGNERYLVVIPYFHIYAFSVCMMVGLRIGALQIVHPKYDPEQVLASIRDFRPTYFPAVPTVFVSLLNHPKVSEYGLEHVRLFNSGGAPCPVEVMEEFERRIGRPLNEGYGLSETSPVTHSTPQLAYRKLGSIGLPFPDTDLKIVDVETGSRELPFGESGELCVCGPQVMKGYWNKPEETANVLRTDADGRRWFHTGDIARMDEDGYTSIVQRKKDMIIVDGFNVYPSEVESVLYTHPAVRLAAVIGIPDRYHGETVKACIALKPGTSATADEVIAYCRESLTEYKVPRQVEIRDTLPMSAVGKILYRLLRDEHAASANAASVDSGTVHSS
ncbi:MAG TPA: long-chain fatty acid--CoA ligase [Vicinamibacterales bacterium]|jgi:long-chain acyl-CoA synthetase|nr:long-chain fatty acid--CoA ligase [Vicinamibacterales bacterium]